MSDSAARDSFQKGENARQSFNYAGAQKLYEAALAALDQKEKLSFLRGEILNALGLVNGQLGDYDRAIQDLREALEIRQSSDDYRLEQAYTLNNLGLVAEQQYTAARNEPTDENDLKQAGQYYEASSNLLGELESTADVRRARAVVLNNLSLVKTSLNDHDPIPELLQIALNEFKSLTDHQGVGQTLHNMAYTQYVALTANTGIANVSVYGNIGSSELTPEALEPIQKLYQEALEQRKKGKNIDLLGQARTLNSLGCLCAEYVAAVGNDERGLLEKATTYLEKAQRIFGDLEDPIGIQLVADSFVVVEEVKQGLTSS